MSQGNQPYYTSSPYASSSQSQDQDGRQGRYQSRSQGRGTQLPPIREILSGHFTQEESSTYPHSRVYDHRGNPAPSYPPPPTPQSQGTGAPRGRRSTQPPYNPPGVEVFVDLGAQGLVPLGQAVPASRNSMPRNYKCPTCGDMFDRRATLEIHERTHTGERPFVCSFPRCGKSFTVKSNATRHERTHYAGSAFESVDHSEDSARRGGSSYSKGAYYSSSSR
ncbi:hypothetical protein BU17DRAFT_69159 [Hysterangium stoloniferum]|nr:hypothetical protein BU17DRAFT_69159 [Hysterangium stoloniferum]